MGESGSGFGIHDQHIGPNDVIHQDGHCNLPSISSSIKLERSYKGVGYVCVSVCVCDREASAISSPYLEGIKWHQPSAANRFADLLSMSKIHNLFNLNLKNAHWILSFCSFSKFFLCV